MQANSPLLKRCQPYPDESFLGYIVRVTELNYFDSSEWILDLAGLRSASSRESLLSYIYNGNHNFSKLSQLLQVDEVKLWAMIPPKNIIKELFSFKRAKICLICLGKYKYYKAIWHLKTLTTCVEHQCRLISNCPTCDYPILMRRKSLCECICSFNFTQGTPLTVNAKELKLDKFILKHWKNYLQDDTLTRSLSNSSQISCSLKKLIPLLEFVSSRILLILRNQQKNEAISAFYSTHSNKSKLVKTPKSRTFVSQRSLDSYVSKLLETVILSSSQARSFRSKASKHLLSVSSIFPVLQNPTLFYGLVMSIYANELRFYKTKASNDSKSIIAVLRFFQVVFLSYHSEIYFLLEDTFQGTLLKFLDLVGIKFITIQWTSENGEKAIEQKFSLENINFQLYQTSKELGLPDLDLLTAVASHKKHYESQIKELPDTVERELFLSISTKLG